MLRHTEDAEDLVQDAFLAALEHLDDFQADRPFWPWFSRILVNRGLDRAASRKVRETSEIPPDVADPGVSPAVAVERSEIAERFRHALEAMPPRQRLVVQLFELDGLSVGEIATTLGSSPATVRWHLHMSRRQLRTALSALQEDL
jgi:RNA polymerase sigma-70 factor, ECF subfamily